MNKNYNQSPKQLKSMSIGSSGNASIQLPNAPGQLNETDQGQAGDHLNDGPKLDSSVQLNLENLAKIDEKL